MVAGAGLRPRAVVAGAGLRPRAVVAGAGLRPRGRKGSLLSLRLLSDESDELSTSFGGVGGVFGLCGSGIGSSRISSLEEDSVSSPEPLLPSDP